MKFPVKRLGFISNLLISTDRLCGRESEAMEMAYSFIGILDQAQCGEANFPLGDRLSNSGQGAEIKHDFRYVRSGWLNLVPLKQRSGRYRLKSALPI